MASASACFTNTGRPDSVPAWSTVCEAPCGVLGIPSVPYVRRSDVVQLASAVDVTAGLRRGCPCTRQRLASVGSGPSGTVPRLSIVARDLAHGPSCITSPRATYGNRRARTTAAYRVGATHRWSCGSSASPPPARSAPSVSVVNHVSGKHGDPNRPRRRRWALATTGACHRSAGVRGAGVGSF